MPTRTVNLKMVVGTKAESAALRRALWTTHVQVNRATAEIERLLLLCRGRSYWTIGEDGKDLKVPESHVVEDALCLARSAQRCNRGHEIGTDEEVLSALRGFYENIVPSCRLDQKGNPIKADAQSIGSGYAGPLFDPDTCAIKEGKDEQACGPFAETASKLLENQPKWLIKIEDAQFAKENPEHFTYLDNNGNELRYRISLKEANFWYDSPEIQNLLSENKAFNKDNWKKKKVKNDPAWAVDFAKKQMALFSDPRILIRNTLWKKLGLLPLGRLFFNKESVGNLWNRLAMRLAVAHLLSWESWNHNTLKEHQAAMAVVDRLIDEYRGFDEEFAALREYEAVRHRELKEVAFANDDRPFKIGVRSIRAWKQVREKWVNGGLSQEERIQSLNDMQTSQGGRFGDPTLYRWLAISGRERLWRDSDCLTPLVKLNTATRLMEGRKKYSLMTFADARLHPRWAMFEAPGGSNLRKYAIENIEKHIFVILPLLVQEDDGRWREREFKVRLAPSGQLSDLSVGPGEGKKTRIRYRSSHQDFEGALGGAELLFERSYLETHENLDNKPGPVWFKLTIDVQSQAPGEWLDGKGRVATPPEVHHFNTALANKSKHAKDLRPGLRVLSVDLGLRSFACCSVFELIHRRPEGGLYLSVADDRGENDPAKLWAKHIRSFRLDLPGETPSKNEQDARMAAWSEIRSIKSDMVRLKDILRLSVVEAESDRLELLEKLETSFNNSVQFPIKENFFASIKKLSGSSTELWRQHCHQFYDEVEKTLSKRFSQWRKRTRPKSDSWQDWRERRSYYGGKSIWMLEYLDAVRKLILSWNLRGRTYGEVNRQDKKKFGTVASNLLHHINQLKEDRIKAGADLIIQAARGFVPVKGGKGWVQKHAPCRVILFEDLARYRFRVDRPRRENSQLMKWNHREILAEAAMQAELYGMVVETTAAGFSSRFLASNGTPGFRCRLLRENDFNSGLPQPYVVNELDWMLGNSKNSDIAAKQAALGKRVRPGDWVPWRGGELFASLKEDGKTAHLIHADINAAQNLQRRFWGRCGDAFRITCRAVARGAADYELDKEPGVRLLGALQQLENGNKSFVLTPDTNTDRDFGLYRMQPKTQTVKKLKPGTSDGEHNELEEALAELEDDSGGERETFFRDPAGTFFNSIHWAPSKKYWSTVRRKVWDALKNKQRGTAGGTHDDILF